MRLNGSSAYHSGVPKPSADRIVYWYRLNPSSSGSPDGTTGNNPEMGQTAIPPGKVSQDKVFATAFVSAPSDIKIQIGNSAPTSFRASTPGLNHYSVPFNGQTGPVVFSIVQNNREIVSSTGQAITDQCKDGNVNWNAFVGSSDSRPKRPFL